MPHVILAPTVKLQRTQLVKCKRTADIHKQARHTVCVWSRRRNVSWRVLLWLFSCNTFAVFQEGVGTCQQEQLHHICLSFPHRTVPERFNDTHIPLRPASCYICCRVRIHVPALAMHAS